MAGILRMRTRAGRSAATRPDELQPAPFAELREEGVTWVHVERPTRSGAEELAARFGWHPLAVEDVVSRRERPKLDVYGDDETPRYLFAVLHFPVYNASSGRLDAGELDAFVGCDHLVTLTAAALPPVTTLFRRCAESEELRRRLFALGAGRLFYELLDDLYDYCFPILDVIAAKLRSIDERIDEVVAPRAKERVHDIHKVKQEIIAYRRIVRPQRPTLRQLERHVERVVPDELELYFDDIVDRGERIWDLLDNYKEVVDALEDTNESLISHQQSDILYVLTIFSVVMLPLTFITGFFGMNVAFPGFDSVTAFFVTVGLMLAVIAGMLGFFRYRRWL